MFTSPELRTRIPQNIYSSLGCGRQGSSVFSLRQGRESLAKKRVETVAGFFAVASGLEGLFGGGAQIAEIDERRKHVFFYGIARDGAYCGGWAGRRKFVAEFEHHALGGFLSDPGDAREASDISSTDSCDHFVGGHSAQNGYGELGADAADGEQLFEKAFFFEAEKSEEAERIFADVRVDVKRDFAASGWQF